MWCVCVLSPLGSALAEMFAVTQNQAGVGTALTFNHMNWQQLSSSLCKLRSFSSSQNKVWVFFFYFLSVRCEWQRRNFFSPHSQILYRECKAAYGTNTGIICVCGHVTGKGAPASQFCRGKKREIQTKLGENGAKQYQFSCSFINTSLLGLILTTESGSVSSPQDSG